MVVSPRQSAMQDYPFALCYCQTLPVPSDGRGVVVAKGYVAEAANNTDCVGRRVALTRTRSAERVAALAWSGDIAVRLRGQRLRKPKGTCLGLAVMSWRSALAAAIPVRKVEALASGRGLSTHVRTPLLSSAGADTNGRKRRCSGPPPRWAIRRFGRMCSRFLQPHTVVPPRGCRHCRGTELLKDKSARTKLEKEHGGQRDR